MKVLTSMLATFSLLFFGSAAFADSPTEILAPVDKVFIPEGFDDNDVTEIMIHGDFPNSCYQVGEGHSLVNQEEKKISVWVVAYKYQDDEEKCLQVLTPYLISVKVGILEQGVYEVKVENAPSIMTEFNIVARTTESPDDYLYAPVAGGNIEIDNDTGRQSLRLVGTYPHTLWGCMKIVDVRMELGENKVLVVLPIMETFREEFCEDYKHDFDGTYGLNQPLIGENVLHVRSINGNSYNRLVQLN